MGLPLIVKFLSKIACNQQFDKIEFSLPWVIHTPAEVSTTGVVDIPGATLFAITPDGRYLYTTDVGTKSLVVADFAT
jgi:hypothetical protein